MALIASAASPGDTLRQEVLIDGRHRLVTDEPVELGGTDEGATPQELVAGALAACVATTIRVWMRRRAWNIGELRVDVRYDQTATPCEVEINVHLPEVSDEQRVRVLAAIRACRVRKSIEGGMHFHERLIEDMH